jgi:hypothetical protein
MTFFLDAIKKEPLGALAIVAALLPFIFDVAKEYIFNSVNIEIQCDTPKDTDYQHSDGFLYYEARCLVSNRSRDPVSVISLIPVMTHGKYPYPLVGVNDFIPSIEERSPDRLGKLVYRMESVVPANMGGRQSFGFRAVFSIYVGELRPFGPRSGCSDDLEFEILSSVYSCMDDSIGDHPAERRLLSDLNTIKEQIYTGFSISLASFDGFGIMVVLGDGTRFLIEADMTDVKGYRCNEDVRELACSSSGSDNPSVINIGPEPDYYSRMSWRVVASIFATGLVASIFAQLVWALGQSVSGWYKTRSTRRLEDDGD